jgi:hypothetical protein
LESAFGLRRLDRLNELSVALLLTTRPFEAEGDGLDSIAEHPSVREQSPAPLGARRSASR